MVAGKPFFPDSTLVIVVQAGLIVGWTDASCQVPVLGQSKVGPEKTSAARSSTTAWTSKVPEVMAQYHYIKSMGSIHYFWGILEVQVNQSTGAGCKQVLAHVLCFQVFAVPTQLASDEPWSSRTK